MIKKQLPSLVLRNLIFTILQPGVVVGLLPYLILKNHMHLAHVHPLLFHHYLGMVVFVLGWIILLHCILRFAIDGLGTLSPLDPTKQLVRSGLYKFSRNPMYVGVMTALFGEVLFSLSFYLFIYSIGIFVLFNVFIFYVEEPRLKKDFGPGYETYIKTVRRWI